MSTQLFAEPGELEEFEQVVAHVTHHELPPGAPKSELQARQAVDEI